MRYVLIDIGSSDTESIYGKDLIRTNAPAEVLKEISKWVWETPEDDTVQPSAEENFFAEIVSRGYQLEVIECLDDVEMYEAIGQGY